MRLDTLFVTITELGSESNQFGINQLDWQMKKGRVCVDIE